MLALIFNSVFIYRQLILKNMKSLRLISAFILFSTSSSLLSGQTVQKVSDGIVYTSPGGKGEKNKTQGLE
jgi:hypothetical protein